jgi:hypothetical protein
MKAWLGIETAFMQFQLNQHKFIAALETGKYNVMVKKVQLLNECVSIRMAKWENQSDWSNIIVKLEYKVSLFCQT